MKPQTEHLECFGGPLDGLTMSINSDEREAALRDGRYVRRNQLPKPSDPLWRLVRDTLDWKEGRDV